MLQTIVFIINMQAYHHAFTNNAYGVSLRSEDPVNMWFLYNFDPICTSRLIAYTKRMPGHKPYILICPIYEM